MATTPSTTVLKATGRDVSTGKVITLTKSQPAQLSLFGDFLPHGARDSYSNTIELYDAIPKYFSNKQRMAELRQDGTFLKSLKRSFRHRDNYYELIIKPARLIDKSGNEKEYYPSYQEELVEEALKKIAADRLNGVFLNDTAGVQFTLYGTCVEIKYHLMSALSRRPISAMLQTASRIVSVLPGLLDQRLYLFHTPSQRDESEEHSLASAYWQPIVAPYPQSRGGHHSSSFQERPSIAQ
jgi:hypothetical protein